MMKWSGLRHFVRGGDKNVFCISSMQKITDEFIKNEYVKNLCTILCVLLPEHGFLLQADLIVIDDNVAKRTAEDLGLRVTGTIGVLIKARICGQLQLRKAMAAMPVYFYLQNGYNKI